MPKSRRSGVSSCFRRAVLTLTISAAASLAALTVPLSAARADVKVVQERTLTGLEEMGARGLPINVINYYKGDRFREEMQGRSIVHIYDATADRYYTLNRTDRTYSVQTLDQAMRAGGSGLLARLKVQGTATIGDGGSTRTIAGKRAANYTVQTDLRLVDERQAATLLTVKLEGEQWTTEAIPFPSKSANIARLAYMFSPRASRLLQPYYAKVSEMKGLPLSFDFIITLSGAVNGTFEAHADVKSVSTAPLADYLFKVPATYRLVDKVAEED
jgi:hypothetical protein